MQIISLRKGILRCNVDHFFNEQKNGYNKLSHQGGRSEEGYYEDGTILEFRKSRKKMVQPSLAKCRMEIVTGMGSCSKRE
jgi:hypothetical protein